ncbi:MAG: glutamate synthase subunit beta, partial [Myxococcota bacterium]
EASCTLAINDDAVTIEQIEMDIAERAFAEGWVQPRPPDRRTGRRVAVVGSGPAGLAAAVQLNAAGHAVTVFEAADRIGGLLRYGIPDFKLDKAILDRRLAVMEAEGIAFRPGCRVGVDVGFDGLRAEHDAVLLAIGATLPRDLPLDGRELAGIHFAMDFLGYHNRRIAGHAEPDRAYACEGRRVLILGGGDTGSDCLGTALRAGAAHVAQIELMPRPPRRRAGDNPWPHWPMIHRTSSSQEEGGERDFAVRTERFVGEAGRVVGIEAVRLEPGDDGRLVAVEGSTFRIEADLVLLAVGFVGPDPTGLTDPLQVALDGRGNVATTTYATSVPGVYAAGDARRGQSLIVWAIAEGREAARVIDADLREGPSVLPTRGRDAAFV